MIEIFKTQDIILAAVLKLKGFEITDIERMGNKGTFVFSSVSKQVVREFDLGKSLVEPITFNQAIKSLTTAVRRMS